MRYWKAAYDEDLARDFELRRSRGLPSDGDSRELWLFRILVAIQVLMVSLAGLLFVTSR